jgi:hypothetical protein
MPLARIITESVDDSLELTMQLRARGFLVETVSPDQIPDAPADLEVRLEECSPEDVLSKAAQVTESEDLWVFVAPGALDERARPIRTIPLLPHVFDVPISGTVSKPVRKWPAEAGAEGNGVELAGPRVPATPTHGLGGISPGSGNGGATSEIAPDFKREPASVPPAKSTSDIPPTKVKVVVLPKSAEASQIPEIPERPKPIHVEPVTIPVIGRVRLRGPYKISFRTGARFWKAIAVGSPLAVVAGVLIVVATLRPHLPPPAPAISPAPSPSSTGVKPAKIPLLPPATPQAARPSFPQVTGSPAPEVASPAVPQVALKPVMKPPATPTAKTSQDNTPGKLAASPVAKDSNKTQAAIASKATQARRHAVSSEADIVAEDTVVFYDRKPAGKGRQDPSMKR